jgi:hypothetical protein
MLRALVVALLAANLLFFGWTQGWFTNWIDLPLEPEREPQRLSAQLHPDQIQLVKPGSLIAPPPVCLEAGPFADAEFPAVDQAVRNLLPKGGWAVLRQEKPGTWLVYMGRYLKPEVMERKADELRRRNVGYTEVQEPTTLVPGLSLGRFNRIEDAREAVRRLESQRIHTARIVTLAPPTVWNTIRIPAADASVREAVQGLGPPLRGKAFAPCSKN